MRSKSKRHVTEVIVTLYSSFATITFLFICLAADKTDSGLVYTEILPMLCDGKNARTTMPV